MGSQFFCLMIVFAYYLLSLCHSLEITSFDTFSKKKRDHELHPINNDIKDLVDLSDIDYFKRNLLKPMLRTRVSGTEGNVAVQEHIKRYMQLYGWHLEEDHFKDSTPYGVKDFTNIIATQNPIAPRKLVLACHFDSKYFTEFEFIGATDSAVPCAMLLDLARTLTQYLQRNSNFEVSLQFLFLDGEEAFKHWSDTDSLYGARHLAQKMKDTILEVDREVTVNRLQTIDMLMLLDLIGTAYPRFQNWFDRSTGKWFRQLSNIEKILKEKNLLDEEMYKQPYFESRKAYGGGIQDDHIPFLHKGVPVLHLICSPFPSVWHKAGDNEGALHYPTITNLNNILRVFVAQYMHLTNFN